MSYRFADSLRNVLILLAGCQQTCMTYTIAVTLILLANCQQNCITYTIAACTVKNS